MEETSRAHELIHALKEQSEPSPFKVVVSGVPRNGTSLAMLCLRMAMGEDKILGTKFPRERWIKLERHENETDKEFDLRAAIHQRTVTQRELDEFNASVDMNPNGFWECNYSVDGFVYESSIPDFSKMAVKMVSSALAHTDPRMIGRVIYMIRHPYAVAKSHERIRRMPHLMSAVDEAAMEIHTPEMFIRQTFMAAKWFIRNPSVPRLFVEFEKLVGDPEVQLERMRQFTGLNFDEHPVDSSLQRSADPKAHKPHYLFDYALPMYHMMKREDFEGVIHFYLDNAVEINKEKTNTFCLRLGQQTPYTVCQVCKGGNPDFIRNKIDQAEQLGIDWQNQPCSFECGGDPLLSDQDALTLEESVERNHWLEAGLEDPD